MEKHNNVLNSYNKKMYVLMTLLLCLFFISVTLFLSHQIFAKDNISVLENNDEVFYENKNPINLEQIIENNTADTIKEEMIIEQIDMEYMTRYKQNSELASGVVQVLQEGRTRSAKCNYYKKI